MAEPSAEELAEAEAALRRIARQLPRAEAKVDQLQDDRAGHFATLAAGGWSHRQIAEAAGTTKENVRFWINKGSTAATA